MSIVKWIRRHCPKSLWLFGRRSLVKIRYFLNRVKIVFSPSAVYYCPCCDSRLVDFIAGEYRNEPDSFNVSRYMNTRQDVHCPICKSLPRHRILAIWCEEYLNRLKSKRILYFALEKSMEIFFRRNNISLTSADLFDIADLKLDLDNIEQPDDSWDVVFCNHVLEHVPDYKKALNELYRILRPGGMLICSFPIDNSFETVYEDESLICGSSQEVEKERIRKFGQNNHLRVFGRDSKQLLKSAGFIVTLIDGDTMPDEILPVVGPADYDSNKLFVCVKNNVSAQ